MIKPVGQSAQLKLNLSCNGDGHMLQSGRPMKATFETFVSETVCVFVVEIEVVVVEVVLVVVVVALRMKCAWVGHILEIIGLLTSKTG